MGGMGGYMNGGQQQFQYQQQPPPSPAPAGTGTAALRSETKQKLASILDNFPTFDSEIKTGIKVGVGV